MLIWESSSLRACRSADCYRLTLRQHRFVLVSVCLLPFDDQPLIASILKPRCNLYVVLGPSHLSKICLASPVFSIFSSTPLTWSIGALSSVCCLNLMSISSDTAKPSTLPCCMAKNAAGGSWKVVVVAVGNDLRTPISEVEPLVALMRLPARSLSDLNPEECLAATFCRLT